MYVPDSNNDIISKGRKKVFAARQKLELILPNGKNDGILDVGDCIYVVQKIKKGGKNLLRFKVIKFAESEKENTIYSSDEKYFKPFFDKKSNIEGEEKAKKPKPSYRVAMITSLAGGVLGYLMAQRFNRNKMLYGLIGLGIGLGTGIFLIKNKSKNE